MLSTKHFLGRPEENIYSNMQTLVKTPAGLPWSCQSLVVSAHDADKNGAPEIAAWGLRSSTTAVLCCCHMSAASCDPSRFKQTTRKISDRRKMAGSTMMLIHEANRVKYNRYYYEE
ncbi:unnamed protein product, partial [Hapterophycus canaliculatus]